MKKILLVMLLLSLFLIFGCELTIKSLHKKGNYYICIYSEGCKGDIGNGYSCTNYTLSVTGCEVTPPLMLAEKIENIRNYIPPDHDIVKSYGSVDKVPKPRLDYYNYPPDPKGISNQISTITCNSTDRNYAFVFEGGNKLIRCGYVGLVQ